MNARVKRAAVFLDKDGTLVEDIPGCYDTNRVRFYPGVFEGLRLLHRNGYALVIVTNQSGVALGHGTEHDVKRMESFLRRRFKDERLPLDGFYYCPHQPAGIVEQYAVHCLCRKPKPGLLIRAASEIHLDVRRSWMVGDILHDVEAGRWAGCRTVLVNNGHETEWLLTETRWPDYVAGTLVEAAHLIALSSPPSAFTSTRREEPHL
jgi:D-glycero-D-manno-heptose 1,7-bisphosphate phosphatase